MKRPSIFLYITVFSASLMLSACTHPKTSAERHARHYVYTSDNSSDPNFYTKKADSVRLMTPFFQYFWNMGEKDRAAGMSQEEAQQRVTQLHNEDFLKSIQAKEKFAGGTYENSSEPSPKESSLMAETISAAYLDGYEGRK